MTFLVALLRIYYKNIFKLVLKGEKKIYEIKVLPKLLVSNIKKKLLLISVSNISKLFVSQRTVCIRNSGCTQNRNSTNAFLLIEFLM